MVRCRSDGADRDALVGSRCRLGLNGARAERIDSNELPEIEVVWVSVADGTRTPPHLEDRAARCDRRHNLIEINGDFRGYRDIVGRWIGSYRDAPGAVSAIEDVLGGWWQQAMEEVVLGVLALKGSEYWGDRAVEAALSYGSQGGPK